MTHFATLAARGLCDRRSRTARIASCLLALAGCSWNSGRFAAPKVDPDSAAADAIELYDANADGAISGEELQRCPGMLSKLAAYDANQDGAVDQAEIALRLAELLKHRTGATELDCTVTYRGRPLGGATVLLEPEPYLGDEVKPAEGVTAPSGVARLSIAPEFIPEHLRRLKAVHYGTFKVRITHPSIPLPARYNSQSQLGYETEAGNPYVAFNLTD